jgi:hypothetical protein
MEPQPHDKAAPPAQTVTNLPKKLAAHEGAAKFREETSKKAAHHVPCDAHFASHRPKRKRDRTKNHQITCLFTLCCINTTGHRPLIAPTGVVLVGSFR